MIWPSRNAARSAGLSMPEIGRAPAARSSAPRRAQLRSSSPAACEGQHGGRGGAWAREGLAAGATADGTAVGRCAVPPAHLAPPSVAIWGRSRPSEREAQLMSNWAIHGKSLSRGGGSGGKHLTPPTTTAASPSVKTPPAPTCASWQTSGLAHGRAGVIPNLKKKLY